MTSLSVMTVMNVIYVLLMFIVFKGHCANHTIQKCCHFDQILMRDMCLNANDSLEYDYFLLKRVYQRRLQQLGLVNLDHFMQGMPNCQESEENMLEFTMDDQLRFNGDGMFSWGDLNKKANPWIPPDEYCVEMYNGTGDIIVYACNVKAENRLQIQINKYGFLISIPFLIATLLVYVILPDKKIQTKCLMAYLTCLTLAYCFLVHLQFNPQMDSPKCKIIAAFGVYFFMSTFCWMNVTCIDMYWTFSGKRAPIQGNSSKWKRFLLYCGFANGAPLLLVALILGLNTMEKFPGHPEFGIGRCWLSGGTAELLYFYGPMAILLTINTILFAITAHTIRTTMRDNQKMLRSKDSRSTYNANRQDYYLYIKLFIAMGINWIMEFISWFVNWHVGENTVPWLWYPTDFCNAIYGMIIFIIFVCKRAVWIKLKQRYFILMGKPNMARALSTHQSSNSHTERTNVEDTTTDSTNNYQIKMNRM